MKARTTKNPRHQEGLRFVAWAGPIIERLSGKLAARDQLIARPPARLDARGRKWALASDRCRYFDRAWFGGGARRLDVLAVETRLAQEAAAGKDILLGVVSMVAG